MVFGTQGYPTVAAVGGGQGGSGGSATLVYPGGGVASGSVPSVGFECDETFNIRGSEGIVTLHTPGHCPTKVTVNGDTFEYPLVPYPYFDGCKPPPLELPATCCSAWLAQNASRPPADPQCNQHGFYYEVEAVHRCLAKGLRETPQHTRADCKRDTLSADWPQSR